jgi:hypothetical protein
MNDPQKTFKWPWKIKVSSTSSKFRFCASLKSCDLQILGTAWKCLRGNLSTKKYFFSLKISNLVQSFVECKVSLADGMSLRSSRAREPLPGRIDFRSLVYDNNTPPWRWKNVALEILSFAIHWSISWLGIERRAAVFKLDGTFSLRRPRPRHLLVDRKAEHNTSLLRRRIVNGRSSQQSRSPSYAYCTCNVPLTLLGSSSSDVWRYWAGERRWLNRARELRRLLLACDGFHLLCTT